MLTARAKTTPTVTSEATDCTPMVSFAQRLLRANLATSVDTEAGLFNSLARGRSHVAAAAFSMIAATASGCET